MVNLIPLNTPPHENNREAMFSEQQPCVTFSGARLLIFGFLIQRRHRRIQGLSAGFPVFDQLGSCFVATVDTDATIVVER